MPVGIDYAWVEGWVASLKREANLSPSTIRKRVGALARCYDWLVRRHPDLVPTNPLRLLPRSYATYTPDDQAAAIAAGGAKKGDISRDRRLSPEEEGAIREILAGEGAA